MKSKIIYILIIFTVLSCETTKPVKKPIVIIEDETSQEDNIKIPEPTDEEILNDKIDKLISTMSIEEKVGQLFMFDIRGYLSVDQDLISFMDTLKPGGIILFANNIVNNDQVLQLNMDLQANSKIPLFISVDEEGGLVSRLGRNKNVDVTYLPPALTVGNKNNPELAYNTGKILGRELKALGFNMDMAPDADVNTNPANPVIGNRTYSADPDKAGEMVVNVINGFHEENMIAVIKHFPGHGDTGTDTHHGTVVSPHNRERLEQIEFVPFKKGIEAGVDAIMSAHVTMTGITSNPTPSTLNYEIITGILRDDMGFDGIIITDAMDMGAITQIYSSAEAAVLAINAGIDIVLIPSNPIQAFNGVLEAVNNGTISSDRLHDSLRRIIKLKYDRGIMNGMVLTESILDVKADPEHQALIQTIFN